MKLSRLGEFGLIERLRRVTPKRRGVRIGIGDDAALIETGPGPCLITADLLLEGVHFNLRWISLRDLGYKALAVNLSDIAAMGGIPAYAVLSIGIPADFSSEKILEFYRGLSKLAGESGVAVIGGDTSAAASLLISVCLIGHSPHPPVTRGGATAGDDIYVSGTLGDSALALSLLRSQSRQLRKSDGAFLLARHRRPSARLELGAELARCRLAKAMIDVSDGLLQDLGHICKASDVGAVLWEEKVPLSRPYRRLSGVDGMACALNGGEDYELLFCARPRDRSRIAQLGERLGVPITRIGCCVAPRERIKVLNHLGRLTKTRAMGHDHFKRA